MEFFTVSCQRNGKVCIDGNREGGNRCGDTLRIFQCPAGLHDVSLECLSGRKCRIMTQRVMISGTTAIVPLQIHFVCANDDL